MFSLRGVAFLAKCHNALSCKVCMGMLVVLIHLCVVFGHHHGVSGCRLMGAGAVVFLLAQRGKTAHMVMVTVPSGDIR